jgi:hypothetical protein
VENEVNRVRDFLPQHISSCKPLALGSVELPSDEVGEVVPGEKIASHNRLVPCPSRHAGLLVGDPGIQESGNGSRGCCWEQARGTASHLLKLIQETIKK